MRVIRASLLLVLLVLLGGLLPQGSASAGPSVAVDDAESPGKLVLLLDSSGSMKEAAPGGTTKIEAAKRALDEVTEKLPDDAEVGVRVFGATVEDRSKAGACVDTQRVVPVGPLDRSAIDAAVEKYEPFGETPIGNALKGAARDLGPERAGQQRTIVLLSDGEPTCAPDPCVVARQLRRQGIDLRINVVGLDVQGKARSALQCIARAGGGRYFDATDADDLSDSMVQVSVRPLRRFSVSGEPVTGGTSTADPAEIEPGDYVDTSLPNDQPRFYLVDVPKNGGVSASVLMRPGNSERLVDTLGVRLMTLDGQECAQDLAQGANVLGLRSILGSAALFYPVGGRNISEPCQEAEQLLVQVSFDGPPTRYELKLRGYPAITDEASLPAPVDIKARDTWQRPARLSGLGTPIVGGASFESAPELEPGTTYADTLRPREQLIYKVEVPWGQSPRMTARLETDPTAAEAQSIFGVQAEARAFNALGALLAPTSNPDTGATPSGRYNGDKPVTITEAYPPVRLRNLVPFDSEITENAIAGDYYFTIEMGGGSDRAEERFAAPVRIAVELDGERSGEPSFADDVSGAPPSPNAKAKAAEKTDGERDESSSTGFAMSTGAVVLLALGALLVVATIAAAGFAVGRRRR